MRRAQPGRYPAELEKLLPLGYHGPRWAPEHLQMLDQEPDDVVAGQVGRSVKTVRVMRTRLGIPTARDGRRRE